MLNVAEYNFCCNPFCHRNHILEGVGVDPPWDPHSPHFHWNALEDCNQLLLVVLNVVEYNFWNNFHLRVLVFVVTHLDEMAFVGGDGGGDPHDPLDPGVVGAYPWGQLQRVHKHNLYDGHFHYWHNLSMMKVVPVYPVCVVYRKTTCFLSFFGKIWIKYVQTCLNWIKHV